MTELQSRCWNGITVRHVMYQCSSARTWVDLGSSECVIAHLLEQRGMGFCDSRVHLHRPPTKTRFGAGQVTFVPANCSVWGYSEAMQMVRDLRLSFSPSRMAAILDEDLCHTKLATPVLSLYDDRVMRCAALLVEQLEEALVGNRLYGESLTLAMATAFFGSSTKSYGGLSNWQLRQAIDFLEHHLTQDISFEQLARSVGLSQSQFARSFKASTGLAPYRWCLEARVKRSQQLLYESTKSIAEIALETGFADQSHFTKTFQRVVGATPKFWRQQRRY